MEVVSASRRGPHTIYTVKEGDRVWQVERKDLPDDVFHRWRNFQAAECMRRRRQRERTQQIEAVQPNEPATDRRSSQEPGPSNAGQTSSSQQQRDAVSITERLTCTFCCSNEVNRIIFPCGHLIFCDICLTKHMELSEQGNKCPYCRKTIKDSFGVILPR